MLNLCSLTRPKAAIAGVLIAMAGFAVADSAFADADCAVSVSTFDSHIYPRHCSSASYKGKSKFLAGYCGDVEDAQLFCEMVQNAEDVERTVQPDNRIRYDAQFSFAVGTKGEQCGRVIITSEDNGAVVTQFPEFC